MVTRDVQENALVRVGIDGQCFLVLSELAGKKKRRDKKWERRFLIAWSPPSFTHTLAASALNSYYGVKGTSPMPISPLP